MIVQRRARRLVGATVACLLAAALWSPSGSAVAQPSVAEPGTTSAPAGGTVSASVAPGSAWYETDDRETTLHRWAEQLAAPVPPPGWTGSVERCDPGTLDPAYVAAITARISFVRAMAGVVPSITLDDDASREAQAAAVMMSAQGALSHFPPPDWACWSQAGSDGAGTSNLMLGAAGPAAVDVFIEDPGVSNAAVGHRRWLLSPALGSVGVGDVPAGSGPSATQSLVVVHDPSVPAPTREGDGVVLWPPRGYLPADQGPPRWSVQRYGRAFSGATASVTVDGAPVAAPVVHADDRGLTFEPAIPGLGADTGVDRSVEVRVTVPDGGPEIAWTTVLASVSVSAEPAPAGLPSQRWAGEDRYATAAEVSRQAFPDGFVRTYVVSGEDWPDGLTASAAPSGPGPLLLARRHALPAATAAELARLARLGVEQVVLIGGTAAISDGVESQIAKITGVEVTRLAGRDRYATAADVALRASASVPVGREVYLATGEGYADALAGGATAGSTGSPLLLTARDRLPEATADALAALRPSAVRIVGGRGAVGPEVEAQLAALSVPVVRTEGADRYATAAALSANTYRDGAEVAYLATGSGYADALAVGGAAALARGPVLLARPTCLPLATAIELRRLGAERVVVLGGPGVLGEDVARQRPCAPGE